MGVMTGAGGGVREDTAEGGMGEQAEAGSGRWGGVEGGGCSWASPFVFTAFSVLYVGSRRA